MIHKKQIEYSDFGKRLITMMEKRNIKNTHDLARQMLQAGCLDIVECSQQTGRKMTFEDNVNYRSRSIDSHLMKEVDKVRDPYLPAYRMFFGCSMDYLYGIIDHETHDLKTTADITGLSDDAVNTLQDLLQGSYGFGKEYIAIISALIAAAGKDPDHSFIQEYKNYICDLKYNYPMFEQLSAQARAMAKQIAYDGFDSLQEQNKKQKLTSDLWNMQRKVTDLLESLAPDIELAGAGLYRIEAIKKSSDRCISECKNKIDNQR